MFAVETTHILVAAAVVTSIAYILYFRDLAWGETHPNRWSWLIWSTSMSIEALTYHEVNDDWQKSAVFFISAIACIGITIAIWFKAAWKRPKVSELLCLIASAIAIVLWLIFDMTFVAHIVVIVAVPIAFIPTWLSALKNPADEKSKAWLLWTIGDALTLWVIVTKLEGVHDLPYIVVEFLCHFMTWRMIARRAS